MLTIGKLLSQTRNELGISLKSAEKHTRVRERYLIALEDENWNKFTSRVYIAGAIRSYAVYLGIDPEKAMAYFRRDYEKKEQTTFKKRLPSLQFFPETHKMVIGAFSVIFVFFVFYFGYQINLYLASPEVKIIAPEKHTFRNITKIKIIGHTQTESIVTVFDEILFPNNLGIFEYDFPLKKGINTLKIHVKGANGKESIHIEQYTLE